MSNIVERFEAVCAENSERTAVIYRSGSKTHRASFSQLNDDVHRIMAYLSACGVKQGDRILAFASSSYRLCAFMLAALETGASIMYVDIWARQDSLRSVFSDYKPDMVLVSDKTRYLRPFFGEIGKIRRVINIDKAVKAETTPTQRADIPEDTTALLTMTTGSTGRPKIAVRSHRDLMQQLELINANLEAAEHETVLTTSYIYVFANILNGFTTVMPLLNLGRWSARKLNRRLRLFKDENIGMMITSPDMCLKADNYFPKLKMLYFGGAILNLHEARLIRKKFSNCDCRVIYGSTECNIIATTSLDEFISTLKNEGRALLGRPVNGVRVRLSNDGEILVTSEAMLESYLVNDPSTKETDENGTLWHHTNDMALLDGDILTFLGKNGRFITLGERKIYSNCIEQALIAQLPEIPKCAVLQHNKKIFVFIQKCDADIDAITSILAELGIDKPQLRVIKKIPCDIKHHTKIDYNKLKEFLK